MHVHCRGKMVERMGKYEYDLLVIGGGAAGLTASGMAASLGARTALVERHRLGGDCTWTGCVPSKGLIKAARVAHTIRTAGRYGIASVDPSIDFAEVMETVRRMREGIYREADSPEVLAERNVEFFSGSATFVDPHTVLVEEEGGPRQITFRYAAICAGASPVRPKIHGADEADVLTNETVFELRELPKRLLVMGGGSVGVELGQALSRLGSSVTIVEIGNEILPNEEPECAAMVREALEEEGIRVLRNSRIDYVEREDDGYAVQIVTGEEWRTIRCDKILAGLGRRPNLEGLGLERAGVEYDQEGITVSHSCQTSADHIYACGDIAHGLNFSHVADNMARTAVTRMLLKMPASYEREVVPWVTFSEPELAHLGMTAGELDGTGERYRTIRVPYSRIDRAAIEGESRGMIVIHASAIAGRILGAHIVGSAAGEMINELALAMKHGLTLRDIAQSVHAYPAWSQGIRKAADQWYVQQSPPGLLKVFRSIFNLRGEISDKIGTEEAL